MQLHAHVVRSARRILGPWKRRLLATRPKSSESRIREHGWYGVELIPGLGGRRIQASLDDQDARLKPTSGDLKITMPDVASFARLTVSGIVSGRVDSVELRIDHVPEWLVTAARPPRLGRDVSEFSFSRNGAGLQLRLAWRRPQHAHRALGLLLGTALRVRLWDQANSPLFAVDRTTWLDGASTWPQAIIAAQRPGARTDDQGRPVGPYRVASISDRHEWSIVSAVANPYGRAMQGSARAYALESEGEHLLLRDDNRAIIATLDPARSPEASLVSSEIAKYSVVRVHPPAPDTSFARHVLRTLAAFGVVLASSDPTVRKQLSSLGLVVVNESTKVDDLSGYALSAEASRNMAIAGDAALRQTRLAGRDSLELPSVTAVISSKRPDDVFACLDYLSTQTYPTLEVILGTHGYTLDEETRRGLASTLNLPFRDVHMPEYKTLGESLGCLTRIADGELITKVDDDDHYGPNHITDLVVAWHQLGADMVAKGARFVYLPDHDKTIDRTWAAPEKFNVQPAGGTLLIAQSALHQVGGWSPSSFHVDADLITRVRAQGGITYRTHSLEYGYVRRSNGHTWSAELDNIIEQGERTYDGLPKEILGRQSAGEVAGLKG